MVSKLAIWSLFLIEASVGAPKLPVELQARQDNPFCGGNGGTWNADTWNNNEMTDFVFNRCNYYSGVGGGSWPPVEGVPRAFAEYGSNGKDSVWNWPTDCRSASDTCSVSDTGLTSVEECSAEWQRGLALWAMRNSAKFIQVYYDAITDAFDSSALKTADIVASFIPNGDANFQMGANAWVILASGVIGAATSFMGPAAPIGGGAAAILTIGIGLMAGTKEAAEDPRFTNFADLQSRLSDMKISMQTAVETTFNRLYRNTPAAGDAAAGTELSNILSSGAWAQQDMAQLKHSKSELITAIHAGMISEAWNSGSHYIVAWRNGLLSDIRGHQLEPCTTPIEDILDETLCINGRNYAFIRNSPRGEVFWGQGGFSTDKLKSFGLSREQVIASSEWRQNEAGTWIDRSYDTTSKMMQSLVGSPPPDGSSLAQFNLAVCNLDDVGGELRTDQGACVSQIGCLGAIAVLNCQHLVMNGVPFPYKNNRFD